MEVAMALFRNKKGNEEHSAKPLPRHVAVIMDGNGRWAAKRSLPRKLGHKAGADALEKITRSALDMGIECLTVYAFSTENWKRSDDEVSAIMDLLRSYLKNYIDTAKKDNVRVRVIGDKTRLAQDIQESIAELEELTSKKTGMTLNIALNYGGRDELRRAAAAIAADAAGGRLSPEDINEDTVAGYLDTAGCPEIELLIRTSGELRISNFLLWQLAYSEFYFTEKLWPDFTPEDFKRAVNSYQTRERRFGGR